MKVQCLTQCLNKYILMDICQDLYQHGLSVHTATVSVCIRLSVQWNIVLCLVVEVLVMSVKRKDALVQEQVSHVNSLYV